MTRILRLWLVIFCLMGTHVWPATAAAKKPLLLAFYHPWYASPDGASKRWSQWTSWRFPERYKPDEIKPDGRRNIASADYPLIGAYNNDDPEVVRWHFRLAKAAGFDGFLCSWWKFPDKRAWGEWQSGLFEQVLLPVAQEEDFKIAVIDECAHYVSNYDALLNRITNNLPRLAKHPGYLKVENQPAWFIYQVWDDWLTAEKATQYVTEAERHVGDVFWMFDKLKAVATIARPRAQLFVKPEWLAIDKIDCFGTYSYFGHWRDMDPGNMRTLFSGFSKTVHKAGKKVQLPVSPGHDNTAVNPEPLIVDRKNGDTLRSFLKAADAAKPDIVVVCSWNEWLETTQVEPAQDDADPYLYLKILAKWRGKKWETPPLPGKVVDGKN